MERDWLRVSSGELFPRSLPIADLFNQLPREPFWLRAHSAITLHNHNAGPPDQIKTVGELVDFIKKRRFTLLPQVGPETVRWLWKALSNAPLNYKPYDGPPAA